MTLETRLAPANGLGCKRRQYNFAKPHMKIALLAHDLSDNSLGRAYILGKALQRNYDVEILGPAFNGEVWAPLREDDSIGYTRLHSRRALASARTIEADVLYAIKPRGTSFGYGLLARRFHGTPLLLDIDDWDAAFFRDLRWSERFVDSAAFWNYNNGLYTWLMEKTVRLADGLTVSNRFLRARFGGTLIPHFRDTDLLDPSRYDSANAKASLGLAGRKVVCFFGTVRRHKGIQQLIDAVQGLGRSDTTLLIVGADPREAPSLAEYPFVRVLGLQPFAAIPHILAAADVVAILQQPTDSAQGQLPAKVFDAMAMAKPIVASGVGDLPLVLADCGIIVTPGSTAEAKTAIGLLLEDAERAAELGRRAREICEARFSYHWAEVALKPVIEGVLLRARATAAT